MLDLRLCNMGRPSQFLWRIWGRSRCTLHAAKNLTDSSSTTFGCRNPRTALPRRIVTDMLVMAALKLRDPMQLFVLVEPYDATLHFYHPAQRLR
jgi:hypothetical protein